MTVESPIIARPVLAEPDTEENFESKEAQTTRRL